ncbi:hypothetical protein FIBSPDRAFT_450208 [Athelia psychrophila]|uniref:Uncharacterized protein n=1 Tax=Athelia psychrophila TaxID=1759441 RepID=A0A166M2E3_9AGAM|nr:hypothetical protein FIBSPDRAFT_450208 [Fibularhizoctonia sp. CBS 109695]
MSHLLLIGPAHMFGQKPFKPARICATDEGGDLTPPYMIQLMYEAERLFASAPSTTPLPTSSLRTNINNYAHELAGFTPTPRTPARPLLHKPPPSGNGRWRGPDCECSVGSAPAAHKQDRCAHDLMDRPLVGTDCLLSCPNVVTPPRHTLHRQADTNTCIITTQIITFYASKDSLPPIVIKSLRFCREELIIAALCVFCAANMIYNSLAVLARCRGLTYCMFDINLVSTIPRYARVVGMCVCGATSVT